MIRILYFGVLRDRVGLDSEELAWNGGSTDALLQHLRDRGPQWAEALAPGVKVRDTADSDTPAAAATSPAVTRRPVLPSPMSPALRSQPPSL